MQLGVHEESGRFLNKGMLEQLDTQIKLLKMIKKEKNSKTSRQRRIRTITKPK